MKISDIITESMGVGGVAVVAQPVGGMVRRAGTTKKSKKKKTKESEKLPSVETHSPAEIAKHHGVAKEQIMQQLKMGIKVEFEHTKDRETAREIALDHLLELPDYYTRLADMEGEPTALEDGNKAQKGIPANATDAELKAARKAGGEKGQRAHWLLNMRKGNGKKK